MGFVRRKEIGVIASLFLLLILLLHLPAANVQSQPVEPYEPPVVPPVPERDIDIDVDIPIIKPVTPAVEPTSCVPCRKWRRPEYTPGRPFLNTLKFLFVPRWRSYDR